MKEEAETAWCEQLCDENYSYTMMALRIEGRLWMFSWSCVQEQDRGELFGYAVRSSLRHSFGAKPSMSYAYARTRAKELGIVFPEWLEEEMRQQEVLDNL